MSILSKVTGIHISPKGVKVEPLKAIGTALTVGSLGGLGPLAGLAGKVGSVASKIPGAAAIGSGIKAIGSMAKPTPTFPGSEDPLFQDPFQLPSDNQSWLDKLTGGNGVVGALQSVGKYALKNPDLILGGLSAYEGTKKGQTADKMRAQALNDPALTATRPDLSNVYGGYQNPYSTMKTVGRRVG